MPAPITGNPETVIDINLAVLGTTPGNAAYLNQLAYLGTDGAKLVAYVNLMMNNVFIGVADGPTATIVLNNLLGNSPTNSAALQTALTDLFAANPGNRGVVVYQLAELLSGLEGNAVYGAAAAAFNTRVLNSYNSYPHDPVVIAFPLTAPRQLKPIGFYYVLTNKMDNINGTAIDEFFVGTEATLGAGDTLAGGGGNDSLLVTTSGAAAINFTGFSISGIKTMRATSDAIGGTNFDLSGVVGTTALVNDNSSTNLSFSNLASPVSFTAQNVSGGDTVINYTVNAAAGKSDILALTLNNNKTLTGGSIGMIQADGIEVFNISTTGGASNIAEVRSNTLQFVVITGNQNLTLHALRFAGGGTLNNVDASNFTGKLDLTLGSNTANTLVNGGSNTDTMRFSGNLADYQITVKTSGNFAVITVHDQRLTLLPVGDVTLTLVERLAFNDQGLALDMAATQSGGKTVLALATALGASTLGDHALTAKALAFFDGGASLQDAATLLVDSGTLAALAGGSDNASLVNFVYHNVFGNAPDASTLTQLQAPLDNHSLTQAQWLAAVEQISVVQQQVHLAGYAQAGLQFAL